MPAPATPPRLTLLGAGRLGRTLARLWAERGVFTIGDVVTLSPDSAAAAVRFIGQGRPVASGGDVTLGDVLLLALPDDRIGASAAALATHARLPPDTVAFHCSGALDAGLLAPLRAAGAAVASVHPMHSFADPAASLASFAGTFCAIEGDTPAIARLEPAFAAIGGRPVRIAAAAKLLYHAGGVFAANYVIALLASATRLVEAAGVPATEARALLAPLLRGAVENGLALGPEAALTGPIARGDSALVGRQAQAVAQHAADLGALYRVLGRATLALARDRGELDPAQLAALTAALDPAE